MRINNNLWAGHLNKRCNIFRNCIYQFYDNIRSLIQTILMVIYLLIALLIANASSQACGTLNSVVASMASSAANMALQRGGHVHQHVVGPDGIIGFCLDGNTCFLNWGNAQAASNGCTADCINGGGANVVCTININMNARDANGVVRRATRARFVYQYRAQRYQGQVVGWVALTGYPTVFDPLVTENAEIEGELDVNSNESVPEELEANEEGSPHKEL